MSNISYELTDLLRDGRVRNFVPASDAPEMLKSTLSAQIEFTFLVDSQRVPRDSFEVGLHFVYGRGIVLTPNTPVIQVSHQTQTNGTPRFKEKVLLLPWGYANQFVNASPAQVEERMDLPSEYNHWNDREAVVDVSFSEGRCPQLPGEFTFNATYTFNN